MREAPGAAGDERPRDVLAEVQRGMLPPAVPVLPGVRVAAGYQAADTAATAGGDWFDVTPVGGGRVALAVGDVVGHGVAAAVAMSQLRTVLRERLIAGAGLAEAIGALDTFAAAVPGARAATVAVATLDLAGGTLRYVAAGHPSPVLVAADGATRFLDAGRGGPLATGAPPEVGEDRVEPDEMLVLFSDGLVERPGRTGADGRRALHDAARAVRLGQAFPDVAGAPADRMCRLVPRLLAAAGSVDDLSLVAAHRTAPPSALRLRFAAEPHRLRDLRSALDAWLVELDVGASDRFFLQHAVGELTANAVEHAYAGGQAGEVQVDAALTPAGEIVATVADRGRWRAPRDATWGGRGLAMTAALTDAMEIERTDRGTTATVRLRLRRPALLPVLDEPRAPAGEDEDRGGPAFALAELDGAGLAVTGVVDATTAPRLRQAVLTRSRGGTRAVEVDLSAVTLLGSAGVQVLHDLAGRAATHRVPVRLVAPTGCPARDVLVLVELTHLLHSSPGTG